METEVRILDVKGLNCPMPLLKAKKALNEMAADEVLKVLAHQFADLLDIGMGNTHTDSLHVVRGQPQPEANTRPHKINAATVRVER